MQITPKRAVAIIGAIITVVSFSRVCVLFLEALSAVRDERAQDSELLEVCASGVARGSMKMRAACLQAQADRASPIVLKAVLRAVSTAFEDFSESVSSPGKLLVVVLFVLSSIFLPVTSWLKAAFPHEVLEGCPHIVVLADGDDRPRMNFRKRVAGALKFRKGSVASHSCDDFDVECDTSDINGMVKIDLGGGHEKWE
tara:strand:- start:1814 stop:2407 length:594 start_codon:yes stop_codon:yes gene_type:complete